MAFAPPPSSMTGTALALRLPAPLPGTRTTKPRYNGHRSRLRPALSLVAGTNAPYRASARGMLPNSAWSIPTMIARPAWGPVLIGPAAGKVRKVGNVERHHDPAVTGGKFKQRLIGHAIEVTFFVGGADVVAPLAKSGGDTTPGDMGVEQRPHRSGQKDLDRRVVSHQLVETPAVTLDERVDLLTKSLVVDERHPDLGLGQAPSACHRLDRASVLERTDDLPDVKAGPHDPGPSVPVVTPERDTGEGAGLERFLGQRCDDRSFGALDPPGLVEVDERPELVGPGLPRCSARKTPPTAGA
jgi:hypothetical protein